MEIISLTACRKKKNATIWNFSSSCMPDDGGLSRLSISMVGGWALEKFEPSLS